MQLRLFIQPLFDWQVEVEVVFQTLLQAFDIPHLLQRLRRNMGIDSRLKHVFADAVDGFADVRHVQQFVTLGVNRPALVVGHIIIFQQLLTNIEVTALNFTLRVGDSLGDPRVLNGFAGFHPQFTHHAGNAIGGEDTHQGVFHRQVEAGRTGIPLTTGTAAQLVIDTA